MLRNLNEAYTPEFSAPKNGQLFFFTSRADQFLFEKGEEVTIYLATAVRTMTPVFQVSGNLLEEPFFTARAEGGISYIWKMTVGEHLLTPGFYDIRVQADLGNGQTISGSCTFGYDLEHVRTEVEKPKDFMDFWRNSLKKLDGVKLDARHGESTIYTSRQIDAYNVTEASLPMDYDPDGHVYDQVESCEVSFQSVGGLRIHGWFAKPAADGVFPAMLVLPGAGFFSRPRPLEHARHGYAALDIQVHGQPVDGGEKRPTKASVEFGDTRYGMDHYYNTIYLHCIQAVNYLCSRGDIDTGHIAAVGGSQGGRLSLTTAALDARISAVVAGIAHYANRPYLHWVEARKNGMCFSSEETMWDAYYDVVNFAAQITCPVLLNGGLTDRISPPEGVLAVYRKLQNPEKKLIWLANMGHDWSFQFDREAWKWLKKLRMEET